MPTLPTFDDLYNAGKAEVQSRNSALTDFNPGSNLDAITGAGAILADEVIRVAVDLFAAHFVDTAEGDDLDALALDRFGLERNEASAAVGTLTFTRGSYVGVLNIPAGTTVRGTVNGQTVSVTTDADANMPAADDEVDVLATCTVTGSTGNVAAGVLETIVDAIPDDADATVTNADRFVGGSAEESDDAFRDRIRRYFGTLRKGTVAALEAAALGVSGVSYVTVDEDFMAPEDGGYVAVYVGDPDARGNDALAELVEVALDEVRAAGVDVRVQAAERDELSVAVTLYVRAGADQPTITTAARAAILAHTNSLAPRAKLYVSQIEAAALGVSADVLGAEVTAPTADTSPGESYQAIRVNAGDLSVTIVEV